MASVKEWQPIEITNSNAGILLVKFDFQDAGYRVLLSDLKQVWEEQLEETAIAQRAVECSCPIDPSEDHEQRLKLFEKLASALTNQPGTTIDVQTPGSGNRLVLKLTSPLPKPLPKLQWTLILNQKDREGFSTELAGPLVELLHRKVQDDRRLHAVVKDKDHIIARLLDRLESSGTDLTSIFPGTVNVKLSRKGPQRAQLYRYVKGLEPYDLGTRTPSKEELTSVVDLATALKGVSTLRDGSLCHRLGFGGHSHGTLVADHHPNEREVSVQAENGTRAGDQNGDETETDEEDFQVQTLPVKNQPPTTEPQAQKGSDNDHAKGQHVQSRHDDPGHVSGSDRANSIARSDPTEDQVKVEKSNKPKRIGMIGRKAKQGSPNETTVPILKDKQPVEPEVDNTPQEPTISTHKKAKMGLVGGRRAKNEQPTAIDTKAQQDQHTDSHVAPQKPSLDHSTVVKSEEASAIIDRSRSEERPERDNKPRETSQERADRRRDELKRHLQSQSVAPKKKRKF